MNVSVEYLGDKKFKANTLKSSYTIDCKEITPVEYFVTGIIGCTGIDLVMMAENDGYVVSNYSVKAEVEKSEGVPMKLNTLHVIYDFEGSLDSMKAKRYVLASLESYCTTINSIRDGVKISFSMIQNGEKIVSNESIVSGGGTILEDGFGAVCGS